MFRHKQTHRPPQRLFAAAPRSPQLYTLRQHKRRIAMFGQNTLVSVIGGIGILGLVLGYIMREPAPELDKHLCEIGKPPAQHMVWFLDPSEALSDVEWRTIQNEINDQRRTLQVGDRLSIVVLAPERAASRVFHLPFSKCRPRGGSMAHPWYDNAEFLDQQYQEQFEQPLKEEIKKIHDLEQVMTSPLLEAFYQIATMESFAAAADRRLFITNHYASSYRFADVERHPFITKKLDQKKLLHQCDVEVFLRHHKTLHTPQHTQFWEQYWVAVGIQSVVVKQL
jgi:hypothetical protein